MAVNWAEDFLDASGSGERPDSWFGTQANLIQEVTDQNTIACVSARIMKVSVEWDLNWNYERSWSKGSATMQQTSAPDVPEALIWGPIKKPLLKLMQICPRCQLVNNWICHLCWCFHKYQLRRSLPRAQCNRSSRTSCFGLEFKILHC